MKKIDFLKLGERALMVVALLAPFSSFAAGLQDPGCGTFQGLRCDTGSVSNLIVNVINILLGIAFLVAVLFLIIGGFRYIISAGNEKTAEEGKKTVLNALIGIVIIIFAYVIVKLVAQTASNGGNGGTI